MLNKLASLIRRIVGRINKVKLARDILLIVFALFFAYLAPALSKLLNAANWSELDKIFQANPTLPYLLMFPFVTLGLMLFFIHWIDKWMYYYGYAFAISRTPGEGMSLIFVCSDDVPKKFRGITAVHEYGDIINQHANSKDERHNKSIRLEFDIAKKDELYDEYIEWIKKRWKSRIEEFSRLGIEI